MILHNTICSCVKNTIIAYRYQNSSTRKKRVSKPILSNPKSFNQMQDLTQHKTSGSSISVNLIHHYNNKILKHYRLGSTSGRLVHWIDPAMCTCHTSPNCESTQSPHKWIINQSCMTGLVPLRLSWLAIFQATVTQFRPPSTLTN